MAHEIRGWRNPDAVGRRVVRRGIVVLCVLVLVGWIVIVAGGESLRNIGK